MQRLEVRMRHFDQAFFVLKPVYNVDKPTLLSYPQRTSKSTNIQPLASSHGVDRDKTVWLLSRQHKTLRATRAFLSATLHLLYWHSNPTQDPEAIPYTCHAGLEREGDAILSVGVLVRMRPACPLKRTSVSACSRIGTMGSTSYRRNSLYAERPANTRIQADHPDM